MNYLGITYSLKNQPLLDKNFIPFGVWAQAYLKDAAQPFRIAVERENGLISVFETRLRSAEFAAHKNIGILKKHIVPPQTLPPPHRR